MKEIGSGYSAGRARYQDRKTMPWLRAYSAKIARRVLAAIEDREDLNQAKLAEALGVSPQQVSKIVQGKENLTLETIYKLSQALKVELISFPDYKYSAPYYASGNSLFTESSINLKNIDSAFQAYLEIHSLEFARVTLQSQPLSSIQTISFTANQKAPYNG